VKGCPGGVYTDTTFPEVYYTLKIFFKSPRLSKKLIFGLYNPLYLNISYKEVLKLTASYIEYQEALKGVIKQKDDVRKKVKEFVKEGIENVFFVGCGGSLAVMFIGKYILDSNSKIPYYIYNSGEFIQIKPKALGKNSLVILASSSGNTPETVEAAKLAKDNNCKTIGITKSPESQLSKITDYAIYLKASTNLYDLKLLSVFEIVLALIKEKENFIQYQDIMRCLDSMPQALVEIKHKVTDRAVDFAKRYKDEKVFLTLGSGICFGQTYSYSICILEEMQWIYAQPIHAGEYFHGPFEVVDQNTNLLILKGEDLTRPLVDRVIEFSKKYTKKITIIDTKEFEIPVAEELRGYFSPFILSAVLDVYSNKLAEERNHPLSTRRYMGKIDY